MSGSAPARLQLPAEWAPQDGVLLAWPHAGTDWAANLDAVEQSYAALVAAIARFEPALVLVPDAAIESRARAKVATRVTDPGRVRFIRCDYDDTWLRDTGPMTLTDGARFELLDFAFTGWGGKFDARRDDRIVGALVEQRLFGDAVHRPIDFALEGGAIDSNGGGAILTTWACLAQRHPNSSRDALSAHLRDFFGAERVFGLEHGALAGDDTDAHIDTLARFAPGGIVHQACDDPADPHFEPLTAMAGELAAIAAAIEPQLVLHALPWAKAIHADDGRRLAASYANYLVINGAVLVPEYGDAADAAAKRVIGSAHPRREIIGVPCRAIIEQNGSLHCLTMQLPQGVLADAR